MCKLQVKKNDSDLIQPESSLAGATFSCLFLYGMIQCKEMKNGGNIVLKKFRIETKRKENLYNITKDVVSAVNENSVQSGMAFVFSPHTTAGITINENADPDVVPDIVLGMDKAYPNRAEFLHAEGNSSAHLKTSAVGASETVIIENGELLLGAWQGIYFCEFDGPRNRTFYVKIIRED